MPRCGNCKNDHPNVAAVRACYADTPTARTSITRSRSSIVNAGLRATQQRQTGSLSTLTIRPEVVARRTEAPAALRERLTADVVRARMPMLPGEEPLFPSNDHSSVTDDVVTVRKPRKVRDTDLYPGRNMDAGENGKCLRCAGTGGFVVGMENDRYVFGPGPCFRCAGKGIQSDCGEQAHAERAQDIADGKRLRNACCDRSRNDLYDRFGIRL